MLLEILCLYVLCTWLGGAMRNTGRDVGPAQTLLVALFFCGEIVGVFAGMAVAKRMGQQSGFLVYNPVWAIWLTAYMVALLFAVLGGIVGFQVGKRFNVPDWVPLVVLSVPISFFLALVLVWLLAATSQPIVRLIVFLCGWAAMLPVTYYGLRFLDWLFERLTENNYKTLLIGRYLRRRRIAWVSLAAVTLCTMMVLVVISVMGGWLNMFEHSFQGLTGDIVVESDTLWGFPFYEEMIERIKKVPGVEAAVPTIHTFGIVNFGNAQAAGVQVMGLPMDQIGQVNHFPESLYRQYQQYADQAKAAATPQERQKFMALANEHAAHPTFDLPPPSWNGLPPELPKSIAHVPGMIPGSMVIGIRRNEEGKTLGRAPDIYYIPVKLTTIALHPGELGVDPKDKSEVIYRIVDDSHTGLWQYDNNFVYVSFDELQKDLQMTAQETIDIDTGKPGMEPARTSDIHIRLLPNFDLNQTAAEVDRAVNQVVVEHAQQGQRFLAPRVETWRQKQHVWIDAISNEKLLTVFLFGIISIVAIFLVFCIFYMIVMEKTKDIGIIKSVGATSSGVAGIFLGYGLVIGLVGSLMGLLSSFLIVHYINELHTMLGRMFGVRIWNPEVYLFDKIPNTMSWRDIAVIVPIAIVASVLGALVPAIRAARMHPVESLRWE